MVARPKSGSGTFQWTTLVFLLLILVFPLALMGTVQAQGSFATNTNRKDLGDGELAYTYVAALLI
jgi:ABC-type sulfate transport system permease component